MRINNLLQHQQYPRNSHETAGVHQPVAERRDIYTDVDFRDYDGDVDGDHYEEEDEEEEEEEEEEHDRDEDEDEDENVDENGDENGDIHAIHNHGMPDNETVHNHHDHHHSNCPTSQTSDPSTSTTHAGSRDMSPPAVLNTCNMVIDTHPANRTSLKNGRSSKTTTKPLKTNKRSIITATTTTTSSAGHMIGRPRGASSTTTATTSKLGCGSKQIGKIRRHRMTKEEEARFNPADLVDLSGSTAAKSRKMTDAERDIMLHKRRLRNRASAARSRDKQRKTVNELSDEMEELLCHSTELKKRCENAEGKNVELQALNSALAKENVNLKQNSLMLTSPSSSSAGIPPLPPLPLQQQLHAGGTTANPAATASPTAGTTATLAQMHMTSAGAQQAGFGAGAMGCGLKAATAPELRRTGSLVRVSLPSDMLDKIMTISPGNGMNHSNNNSNSNSNSLLNCNSNSLLRIPSKLHVSLSTDKLGGQEGNACFVPRNLSVMERLLDLTNTSSSFDVNCDLHLNK